jgi:hypothetical protein
MADLFEQIRSAILEGRYTLSEHAYEEMDDDKLDVLDLEAAILTGKMNQILTDDPRGTRYVIEGLACDQSTRVAVVSRFATDDRLLIITVYQRR